LEESLSGRSDPSLVVGVDVTPSVLELVVEGPKELSLNKIVESSKSTLTNKGGGFLTVVS